MMKMIARIVTGSRMRGYATPESDYDYVLIMEDGSRARQRIVDGEDVLTVPIRRLTEFLDSGNLMFAEMLYSPFREYASDEWRLYIEKIVPPISILSMSNQVAYALAKQGLENSKPQRIFSALMMLINAIDFLETGVMHPHYSEQEIEELRVVVGMIEEPEDIEMIDPMNLRKWIGRS